MEIIQIQKTANENTISISEQALICCQQAKELEEGGDYEGARSAMGELWQRVGDPPKLDGLNQRSAAEVLLRSGALTGWLGTARQVKGAQEAAKNLLSQSIALFEDLAIPSKIQEAKIEIAWSYCHEGAFDEAKAFLRDTVGQLDESQPDLKAIGLVRCALVEIKLGHYSAAHQIFLETEPLIKASNNPSLKGRYYNGLALVQKKLAFETSKPSYVDDALLNYVAAAYHFEMAGHRPYLAMVENNLGSLLFECGKFSEAESHLNTARKLYSDLRDEKRVAETDDTRALLLLAEGRAVQAEKIIKSAVRTLEKGGPQSILAEALTTHATALARLDRQAQAHLTFTRAIEVAGQVGDTTGAGRAALSAFEELASNLDRTTLLNYYNTANDFLRGERADVDMETFQRLTRCAKYLSHLDRERTKSKYAMGGASYVPTENGVSYDFYPDLEIRSDLVPYTAVAATSLFNVDDLSPFARLEGRVIHDRYGKYIAMLDEDLTTLRCPYTERVIATKEDGRFIRPDGDIWALLERPVKVSSIQ